MDAATRTAYTSVAKQIDEIIAHYKQLTKDGWTVDEVWEMTQSGIASFMKVIETIGGISAQQKKAVVLEAASRFYDRVIAPLDIPRVPEFLETRLVDPAIKNFFLKLVSGAVDSLTNIFNRVGWSDVPPGVNGANGGTVPSTPPTPSGFVPY